VTKYQTSILFFLKHYIAAFGSSTPIRSMEWKTLRIGIVFQSGYKVFV